MFESEVAGDFWRLKIIGGRPIARLGSYRDYAGGMPFFRKPSENHGRIEPSREHDAYRSFRRSVTNQIPHGLVELVQMPFERIPALQAPSTERVD